MSHSKRKDKLDQYYTDPAYALYFWNQTHRLLDLDTFDTFVEPCAGTGSFYNLMPANKRYGIDIDPQCNGVVQQDFMNWSIPVIPYGRVLTLTNPPFGRNSQGAIDFFQRSATFSTGIGMVLPRSFKKISLQEKLNKSFHLVWEEDTPVDSFINNKGEFVDVKTVSQIWSRKFDSRENNIINYKHKFTFVKYNDDYDLILRRIGWNSGKYYSQIEEEEKGQFIFIKTHSVDAYNKLLKLDYSICREHTGGGYTINQKDIIDLYFKS